MWPAPISCCGLALVPNSLLLGNRAGRHGIDAWTSTQKVTGVNLNLTPATLTGFPRLLQFRSVKCLGYTVLGFAIGWARISEFIRFQTPIKYCKNAYL